MIIDRLDAALKEGDPQRVKVNLANGSPGHVEYVHSSK
jgi:hypothetical protein